MDYAFGGYRGFWTEAERLHQFGGLPKERADLSLDTQESTLTLEEMEDELAKQHCDGKRATKFQPPTAQAPSSSPRKHFYPPGSNKPSA